MNPVDRELLFLDKVRKQALYLNLLKGDEGKSPLES